VHSLRSVLVVCGVANDALARTITTPAAILKRDRFACPCSGELGSTARIRYAGSLRPDRQRRATNSVTDFETRQSIPAPPSVDPLVARVPFFYGWVMVPAAMLAKIATTPGRTYGVSVFNPELRESLGLSLSRLIGAYMLGTVWVRYYGRRNLGKIRGTVWTASVAGSSAGPFLMGVSFDQFDSFAPALWLFVGLFAPLIVASAFVTPPRRAVT